MTLKMLKPLIFEDSMRGGGELHVCEIVMCAYIYIYIKSKYSHKITLKPRYTMYMYI